MPIHPDPEDVTQDRPVAAAVDGAVEARVGDSVGTVGRRTWSAGERGRIWSIRQCR